MANKAIKTFPHYAMTFRDCHIHRESLFQGKDRKPTNYHPTNDKSDTGSAERSGFISQGTDGLKSEKDAKVHRDSNGDPNDAERRLVKSRIGWMRTFRSGQDDFRS